MIDTKELRRLAQAATPGPWTNHGRQPNVAGLPLFAGAAKTLLARVYSEAYGDVEQETANASFIAAANPAAITELLDRLEAAESDALEQARLNGMGSEREAALMAKLEAAEKEVEIERMRLAACGVAALGYFEGCAEEYISASLNDVLALRAKIEALGKQEPTRDWWDCLIADISAIDCMYRGSPTYAHDAYWMRDHVVWMLKKRRDALPGAKGEDK